MNPKTAMEIAQKEYDKAEMIVLFHFQVDKVLRKLAVFFAGVEDIMRKL